MDMMRTSSLPDACDQLFSAYPLTVTVVNRHPAISSMVLMLQDGEDERFLVLSQDRREDKRRYSLRPWRATESVDIDPNDGAVSEEIANAVTNGVPVPCDGAMFGWRHGDDVSALVAFFTTYAPETPEPSWTVMPRAGIPEAQWPPFTDECHLGHWFWDHYRAGHAVSVGGLIAANPGTAFWVDTRAVLGSGCCAVACDVRSLDGYALRRGRYVYCQVLRSGSSLPSLEVLLADTDKIDLASRLSRSAR